MKTSKILIASLIIIIVGIAIFFFAPIVTCTYTGGAAGSFPHMQLCTLHERLFPPPPFNTPYGPS